jgi:hypothetical protein
MNPERARNQSNRILCIAFMEEHKFQIFWPKKDRMCSYVVRSLILLKWIGPTCGI